MEETPSGTRQIIGRCLSELKVHASKIGVVHDRAKVELTEAATVIKALERALGTRRPSPASPPPAAGTSLALRTDASGENSPRAKFLQRILALVEDGPRTITSIANHFGSSQAYVRGVVVKAHERGQLALSGEEVSAR